MSKNKNKKEYKITTEDVELAGNQTNYLDPVKEAMAERVKKYEKQLPQGERRGSKSKRLSPETSQLNLGMQRTGFGYSGITDHQRTRKSES